jgi:pimeloyl-ACP methyl ester carboxylesterase
LVRASTSPAFEASLSAALRVQAHERASPKINPACHSIVMEHGHRTPRAVAFMHGITSSPGQFRDLGMRFYERGYNVFIPRMPRHGYFDRLTHAPGQLSVAEFIAYASQTIDIARGLGDHLTVAGLSVSGVLAAWCAQTRPDVDLAIPISAAFAPHGLPYRLVPAISWLARSLPNFFVWWDVRERARKGPACSYPRFSTHAMAASFQLGLDVHRAALKCPPACKNVLAITNPRDMAVNNAATRAVLRRWRRYAPETIREYAFGAELGPLHDIIGPYQNNARIDYVYPILLDLVDRAGTAPSGGC